jgi:hypothetical protein
MTRWKYMGDLNLEYGGTFYDFSSWKWGYVNAVEITDMDSACGWSGAIMIESISINIERSKEDQERALQVIGATFLPNGDINDNGRTIAKGTAAWRFCLTYACQAYGYKDADRTEFVQCEPGAPMAFDGWKADKKLRRNASLKNYVRREFLQS